MPKDLLKGSFVNSAYQLPKSGHITTVHRDLRSDVHRFRNEMLRLESELPNQFIFEAGSISPELMHAVETKQSSQSYSRAVQIYALLAVEALLNEYGYLRFGPETFEKKFARAPISTKLIEMMSLAFAAPFDDNCEIVSILKSLAHRRNRHVHLRPEIGSWDAEAGSISSNNRLPATDAKSATAAAEEMETFFKLFSELDSEAAFMLGIP